MVRLSDNFAGFGWSAAILFTCAALWIVSGLAGHTALHRSLFVGSAPVALGGVHLSIWRRFHSRPPRYVLGTPFMLNPVTALAVAATFAGYTVYRLAIAP
jgi:hypothetical protein